MKRFILVLLAAVLSACSLRTAPLPVLSGNELSPSESKEIISRISESSSHIQSGKLLTHAKLSVHGETDSLRYAVLFEKPDKLRIETYPVNGFYVLSLLVSNGDDLVVLDPVQKTFLTGHPNAAFLRRVTGIPAELSEMVSYLTGRPNPKVLEKLSDTNSLHVYKNDKGRVQIVGGNFEYYWEYNGDSGELSNVQIRDPFHGDLLIDVHYMEYQGDIAEKMPKKLSLTLPKDSAIVDLAVSSVKVNQKLKPGLFEASIPEGYTEIRTENNTAL